MRKNVICLTLCAMLFALSYSASAQQPKKIPRIVYLRLPPLPLTRPATRHSARVCASWGTWKGKTLSLNIDMQRENSTASQGSWPS